MDVVCGSSFLLIRKLYYCHLPPKKCNERKFYTLLPQQRRKFALFEIALSQSRDPRPTRYFRNERWRWSKMVFSASSSAILMQKPYLKFFLNRTSQSRQIWLPTRNSTTSSWITFNGLFSKTPSMLLTHLHVCFI